MGKVNLLMDSVQIDIMVAHFLILFLNSFLVFYLAKQEQDLFLMKPIEWAKELEYWYWEGGIPKEGR